MGVAKIGVDGRRLGHNGRLRLQAALPNRWAGILPRGDQVHPIKKPNSIKSVVAKA